MNKDSNGFVPFSLRHNGGNGDVERMLEKIGADSLDELIQQTLPDSIRLNKTLDLPPAEDEHLFLENFRKIAEKNTVNTSYIGMGYYNTHTPNVILRNILENPGWYTAYTPYQAEIAQGRLEALINFQTLVSDLTGMEIANASLLDEGTAAAEAMSMLFAARKKTKKNATKFLVDNSVFPQTLDILDTRATPIGIDIEMTDVLTADLSDEDVFGVFVQYPNNDGEVRDLSQMIAAAAENEVKVTVASDLLSLVMVKSPGAAAAPHRAQRSCGGTVRSLVHR